MSDSLASLQQEFLALLLSGDQRIKASIESSEKVSAAVRLGLYSDAYRLRLFEALEETFPALHTLVGDERFYSLADAYLRETPSQHFSVRYFGHGLAAYLKSIAGDDPMDMLIAEMTEFEWALRDAFDAQDVDPATADIMQTIEPEQWATVVFTLHPSVRLIYLNWNIPPLWQAIDEEAEPMAPEQNEYPMSWLIWRNNLQTFYRSLEVDEAWGLQMTLAGGSFADLCAGLTEWIDEEHAATRAAGLLMGWIDEGLVVGCEG